MRVHILTAFGLAYAEIVISGFCHDVSIHAKITTAAVSGSTGFDNCL